MLRGRPASPTVLDMSSDQPGSAPPPSGSTPPGPPAAPAPGPPGAPAPSHGSAPGAPAPPSQPPHGYPTPGAQPPSGGGGGKGKKTGLIIGLVLLALLLIGGIVTALILILGGDDDSDDNDEPKADEGYLTVVEEFTQAFDDRDCATLIELQPDRFDDVEDCEDNFPFEDADDFSIDVTDTEVTDIDDEDNPTEATVKVTYTVTSEDSSGDENEEEFITDFEVEKDGDTWIVANAVDRTDDGGDSDGGDSSSDDGDSSDGGGDSGSEPAEPGAEPAEPDASEN